MKKIPIGFKKTTVLCILLSDDNKKMLLLKRSKNPHLGKYIAVGGKLEPFESPYDAAKREIFEETGQQIKKLSLIGILTETSKADFNWINYVYVANVEIFDLPECNEGILEWVDIKDIDSLPTPTTDMYIYGYVAKKQFFVLDALYNQDIELVSLEEEITKSKIL